MIELLKKNNKRPLLNSAGFTLFELIISASIVLLMAGIVTPMIGNMVVARYESNTTTKLESLPTSFVMYYNQYGSYPSDMDALVEFDISSKSKYDGWGNEIHYYKEYKINGGSTVYPAVFISNGKNGILDSTINSTSKNITLSDNDMYSLVTAGYIALSDREKTQLIVDRVNAAYAIFMTTDNDTTNCETANSTQCIYDLHNNGLISALDMYDRWGTLIHVETPDSGTPNQMISCGPDKVCNNNDDVE